MKNNEFENLFRDLDFNTEEPSEGHELKFRHRLKLQKSDKTKGKVIYMNLLLPLASIAASVVLVIFIFGNPFFQQARAGELASVSAEMEETQNFYTSAIKSELAKISSEKTPETEAIVNDALKQLENLEENHEKLKVDLIKSGNDKRVIYAMINNYQQRIELLQEVLQKIDEITNLKNLNHENHII